jgi:superfamily II DNA or RNA helicase
MNIQQLCAGQRGEFRLQTHQHLLKRLYNMKRVLLYHGIGSGKTCTAITIASEFHKRYPNRRIYVIVPASLRGNFTKEVNGSCGQHNRVTLDAFQLMSYQGFTKAYKQGSIDLDHSMVIVDEIQNVLSQTGDMYRTFMSAFHGDADFNAIVLTATPMFDKASEIALLGNLLLTDGDLPLPTNPRDFAKLMAENPKVIYTFFKDKVSYYRGADPRAYPEKREHIVECPMSPFQERVYMKSIGHIDMNDLDRHLERAFLITPRQSSNLVLPSGTVGKLQQPMDNVQRYSTKFYKCVQHIRAVPGPAFVYSNFVSISGVDAFTRVLKDVYRFSAVRKNHTPTHPGLRYAVFRANDPVENNRIVRLFNSPQNKDGSLIKVIVGSPAMKEGVSLLRVRSVHILDPYWNRSRTEQIMGRAIRFCSHADLPEEERRVDVFHYYAVPSNKSLSVDLRILEMSNQKIRKIRILETVLQETAFDCHALRAFNEPPAKFCFRHDLVSDAERQRLMAILRNNSPQRENDPPKNNVQPNHATQAQQGEQGAATRRRKPSRKPLGFGRKTVTNRKQRKPKSSCPSNRRPDESTGACPMGYPYVRPNAKGDMCCFKRGAPQQPMSRVKTCPENKVLNPNTKRCVSRTSRLGRLLLQLKNKN